MPRACSAAHRPELRALPCELRDDLEEVHAWAIMGMNLFLGLRYAIWSEDAPSARIADAAYSILQDGIRSKAPRG